MSLNLDVLIDSDDQSVDMKSGLDTMQGVSDAVRCISETVLSDKVPQRQSSKSKVRTTLKKNFKGSYGHIFSVDIYDDEFERKFRSIGKFNFSQIISYFISEALYQEASPISDKARRVVEKMGENEELLTNQLRLSSLENMHQLSLKFGKEVKLRFRKSRAEQRVLGVFNKSTAKALEAKESVETKDIFASITRLNINTGNGRLLVQGEDKTVAFGFGTLYRDVRIEAKKVFSENLNKNNGVNRAGWEYLKILVSPVTLRNGKVIKYIVKGFYDA